MQECQKMRMRLIDLDTGFFAMLTEFVLRIPLTCVIWQKIKAYKNSKKWLTGLCKIMQTIVGYIHIINFLLDQSQERMHLYVAKFMKFSNARVLLMFLTRKNWFFSNPIVRLDQVLRFNFLLIIWKKKLPLYWPNKGMGVQSVYVSEWLVHQQKQMNCCVSRFLKLRLWTVRIKIPGENCFCSRTLKRMEKPKNRSFFFVTAMISTVSKQLY